MGVIKDILGIKSPSKDEIQRFGDCNYTPQEIELALMVMCGYSAKDAKEKVAESLQKPIDL